MNMSQNQYGTPMSKKPLPEKIFVDCHANFPHSIPMETEKKRDHLFRFMPSLCVMTGIAGCVTGFGKGDGADD